MANGNDDLNGVDVNVANPLSGLNVEQWAAVIVLGALVFLIAVKRGFRGINVNASVGV